MPVTYADVETRFQRSFSHGSEQNAIAELIVDSMAAVEGFLDTFVELRSDFVEIKHVLYPDHRLWSRHRIDSMTEAAEKDPTDVVYTALVEDDDFVVWDDERVHRIDGSASQKAWKQGYNAVRFTYDAGYSEIPAQIIQVVTELAYARYLFAKEQGTGSLVAGPLVSERMGDYIAEFGDVRASAGEQSLAGGGLELSRAHKRILAPYRRRYVA